MADLGPLQSGVVVGQIQAVQSVLVNGNQISHTSGLQLAQVGVPGIIRGAVLDPVSNVTVHDIGDGRLDLGQALGIFLGQDDLRDSLAAGQLLTLTVGLLEGQQVHSVVGVLANGVIVLIQHDHRAAGGGGVGTHLTEVGEGLHRDDVAVLVQVEPQNAVLVLIVVVVNSAPVGLNSQSGIGAVVLHKASDDFRILALGGDSGARGILQLRVVQREAGQAAVLAGQLRNGNVLMAHFVVGDGHVSPNTKDTDQGNILGQLIVGVVGRAGSVLEAVRVQQAGSVQLMEVVGSLADGLVHSGEGDGAVDQSQMVRVGVAFAVAIGLAEAASQTVEHVVGTEGVASMGAKLGGHGDLVIHAVAVQVAGVGKGLQHFSQLVGSGGHLHVNLIQPILVDQQGTGGQNQALHLLDVGEAVHVAIGIGDFQLVLSVLVQNLLNGGAILSNQVLGGQEHILVGIAHDEVRGLAADEVPEHVGQVVAGSQHQGDLLGGGGSVRVEHSPLELHAGILIPALHHGHLVDVHSTGSVAHDGGGQLAAVGLFKGRLIGDDGQFAVLAQERGCLAGLAAGLAGRSVARGFTAGGSLAGGRLAAAAAAGKRHSQQQERCQKQRKGSLFHDCTSKKCCTICFHAFLTSQKHVGCGQAPPFLRLGAQSANHFLFKRT